MIEQLIEAIKGRLKIKFKYKDENTFRKAEVYVLGLNANGNLLIRVYEDSSGWKLFLVDQITEIIITSTKYYLLRSGYNSKDKAFKKIVCFAK